MPNTAQTRGRVRTQPQRPQLPVGRCLPSIAITRDRSTGPNWGAYSVDEAALRHGAGVEQETTDEKQAYARVPRREPTRYQEGWLPER
jgi:hypothetical protein